MKELVEQLEQYNPQDLAEMTIEEIPLRNIFEQITQIYNELSNDGFCKMPFKNTDGYHSTNMHEKKYRNDNGKIYINTNDIDSKTMGDLWLE